MKERWHSILLRSINEGRPQADLLEYVDPILVWVGQFDSKNSFSKRCIKASGGAAELMRLMLEYIDQLILFDEQNLVQIFGQDAFIHKVLESGDAKVLKLRYKRLSRIFHPDRTLHDTAWLHERMGLINRAYSHSLEVLEGSKPLPFFNGCEQGSSETTDFANSAIRDPKRSANSHPYSDLDHELDKFKVVLYKLFYTVLGQNTRFYRQLLIKGGLLILAVTAGLSSIINNFSAPISEVQYTSDVSTFDKGVKRVNESVLSNLDISNDDIGAMIDELLNVTSTNTDETRKNRPAYSNEYTQRVSVRTYSSLTEAIAELREAMALKKASKRDS